MGKVKAIFKNDNKKAANDSAAAKKAKSKGKSFSQLSTKDQNDLIIAALQKLGILDADEKVI